MNEEQVTTAADDAAPKPESTESASTPPSEQEEPSLSDAFENAMSEFEGATAETKDDGAAKPKTVDDLREEYGIRNEIRVMRGWAADYDQERFVQRENEDTAAVIERANEALADSPLPDDYAERFLRSEYAINPTLQEAWDNRYESDEAQKVCDREVQRALDKLTGGSKLRFDPDATADRLAVADAVRRGSGKAPEGKAPDYAGMNDKEFQEVRDSLPE